MYADLLVIHQLYYNTVFVFVFFLLWGQRHR